MLKILIDKKDLQVDGTGTYGTMVAELNSVLDAIVTKIGDGHSELSRREIFKLMSERLLEKWDAEDEENAEKDNTISSDSSDNGDDKEDNC